MRGSLRDLAQEARRIGPRAFRYRVISEIARLSGLDLWARPIREIRPEDALEGVPSEIARDDEAFLEWWRRHRGPFFAAERDPAPFLRSVLNREQLAVLEARGRDAARGRLFAFRGTSLDYGWPIDWCLNPIAASRWPGDRHSRRILDAATRSRCGDVKITWESGRFLHLVDLLRAWRLTGDHGLVDAAFVQLEDFRRRNPVNCGPHWMSEQEVAIRACIVALTLENVAGNEAILTGQRLRLALSLLIASARFCRDHLELARICIANNHFIAGALGLYVPGVLLPWHPEAGSWRELGRRSLLEALENQWWPDGAYVQPAHNYHRLALSYLLWALRLGELSGDEDLVGRIRERFEASFDLLRAQLEPSSGCLPNWGPNDGALFPPWTECAYRDFRPLLSSLSMALEGTRAFSAGPWEEQLVWLWGPEAPEAPIRAKPVTRTVFPSAGLHLIRGEEGRAVLRCGPILSRFGQHADQLHVDLWWRGHNLARDAGSFDYADRRYHEWFRGTSAHNTVTVSDRSQMRPHRRFLFLDWPEVEIWDLGSPPQGVESWVGGWHNGYGGSPTFAAHGRILANLGGDRWIVVDLLTRRTTEPPSTATLHWHLPDLPHRRSDRRLDLESVGEGFSFLFAGDLGPVECRLGDDESPDGWNASLYARKDPSLSLRLTGCFGREAVQATWLGPTGHAPKTLEWFGHDLNVDRLDLDFGKWMRCLANSVSE